MECKNKRYVADLFIALAAVNYRSGMEPVSSRKMNLINGLLGDLNMACHQPFWRFHHELFKSITWFIGLEKKVGNNFYEGLNGLQF